MKYGMTSNPSPYRVFTAAEAIDYPFRAVSLGEDGVSLGGDFPIGLTTAETDSVAAGEEVNVQIFGGSLWEAGDSITAGAFLASDSVGCAIPASAGKFIFAQAIDCALEGEVAQVVISRAGTA